MYGDNLLIPGDGPFEGDSVKSAVRVPGFGVRMPGFGVKDWRQDVETIVALSLESEGEARMAAGAEGTNEV